MNTATYSPYVLYDPTTKIIRYVGISTNPQRRYGEHLRRVNDSKSQDYNTYKSRWIRGLATSGQKPALVVIDTNLCLKDAQQRERDLIAVLPDLTNLTAGGETSPWHILPPEQQKEYVQQTLGKAQKKLAQIKNEDPERWAKIIQARVEAWRKYRENMTAEQRAVEEAKLAKGRLKEFRTEKVKETARRMILRAHEATRRGISEKQ